MVWPAAAWRAGDDCGQWLGHTGNLDAADLPTIFHHQGGWSRHGIVVSQRHSAEAQWPAQGQKQHATGPARDGVQPVSARGGLVTPRSPAGLMSVTIHKSHTHLAGTPQRP